MYYPLFDDNSLKDTGRFPYRNTPKISTGYSGTKSAKIKLSL